MATQQCAMLFEVAGFAEVAAEAACVALREATPQARVSNRSNICEISSSPAMAADGCQFGVVLSWQLGSDGASDPESNLALSVWREDGAANQCAVDVFAEVVNQTKASSVSRRQTYPNLKNGTFQGWWLNELSFSQLFDPGKGWLHDGSLHIFIEMSVDLKSDVSANFKIGDRVRVNPSVTTPRYGWGDVSHRDCGTVLEIVNATRMYVEFPGAHQRWTADPLELELLSSAAKRSRGTGQDLQASTFAQSQLVFRDLLSSGALSDLVVETAGGDLNVHAVVLAAASPVFQRMILSPMKEGILRRLDFRHFPESAVRELISFVYTHELQSGVRDNESFVLDLLHLANYFMLPLLARECLEAEGLRVSVSNVFARLELVNSLALPGLREPLLDYQARCVNYILTNIGEVQETCCWSKLAENGSDILSVVDGFGEPVSDDSDLDLVELQTAFAREVATIAASPCSQGFELTRQFRPCVVARRSLDSYRFAHSSGMEITEIEQMASVKEGEAWARVDCPIRADASVQFAFEIVRDKATDEGTCYGIATSCCTEYKKEGALAIRAWNGHFYCDGNDWGERLKLTVGDTITFRIDYLEGKLQAWRNDDVPVPLVDDPARFRGRTFYPTVFSYGTAKIQKSVRLQYCNRMTRGGYTAKKCQDGGVKKGSVFLTQSKATIFACATSWRSIGELQEGAEVVASAPPRMSEGYNMLPIEPQGAVEVSAIVAKLAAPCVLESGSEEQARHGAGRRKRRRTVPKPTLLVCGSSTPFVPEACAEYVPIAGPASFEMNASSPLVPAATGDEGSSRPACIQKGAVCATIMEGPIYASVTSWDTIGTVDIGEELAAAGPPQTVAGYSMVPIEPRGAVETCMMIAKVTETLAETSARSPCCRGPADAQLHDTLCFPPDLLYAASMDGPIFASATCWDIIGTVRAGEEVVAAGAPEIAEGFSMLPIEPRGAVETSILTALSPESCGQPKLHVEPVASPKCEDIELPSSAECAVLSEQEILSRRQRRRLREKRCSAKSRTLARDCRTRACERRGVAEKSVDAPEQDVRGLARSLCMAEETPDCERKRVEILADASVASLKDVATDAVDAPWSRPPSIFQGEMLQEGEVVLDCCISDGDTLSLSCACAATTEYKQTLAVHVQTKLGKVAHVEVSAHASIDALRRSVAEVTKVPLVLVNLSFNNRILEDGVVSDYGISEGATLLLDGRPVSEAATSTECLRVRVQTKMGRVAHVEVSAAASIDALKRSVAEVTKLPLPLVSLSFEGRMLEEGIVSDYGLCEGATMLLDGRPAPEKTVEQALRVWVHTKTGRGMHVEVGATASVGALRRLVAEATKVPLSFVSLAFGGRVLEEGATVSDYGLYDGAALLICGAAGSP